MKKVLGVKRRPDVPVPCPRCDSSNTKFCYFNNYNLKQPRHFCRDCKRYWTAGGSLRNVPIGAGRRKHKLSATPCLKSAADNTAAPKPHRDAIECLQISPNKWNSNGNLLHEVQGPVSWQTSGVTPMHGTTTPLFPQLERTSAKETVENTNSSILSNKLLSNATKVIPVHRDFQVSKLNGETWQDRGRNSAALDLKISEPAILENSNGQDSTRGPSGINRPGFQPLHVSTEYDSRPPPRIESLVSESFDNKQQGELHALPTSAKEFTCESGSNPQAESLPLPSHSRVFESTPTTWGHMMWPWIWPLLMSATDARSLALGSGMLPDGQSLEATKASHIDMTSISVLLRSLPYCAFASSAVPWWNTNWHSSTVGHRFSLNEPEKKEQGLIYVPKTLRMDCLDGAAYNSILKTLGVTTVSQSQTEFLNGFHPKAEVFQPHMASSKAVEESDLKHHHLPRLNPAAPAHSAIFQEGS